MEAEVEALSAAELKASGNDAYKRQDYAAAVEHWNQALRKFVEDMSPGVANSCLLGVESRDLEQSLYLNLSQGYLKLGEPDRALRACVVVLQEDAKNGKALFRAAESCLALKHHEKAVDWLTKLLEAEPAHPEGSRLLQRVRVEVEAERRAEARKQKAAARRMLGACEGFSDGRASSQAPLPDSVVDAMARMEPDSLCDHVHIAEAAASAARNREAAQASSSSDALPEPTVVDLDAFRAKVMAKTQKFGKYMDRTKKQREKTGHGLKLAWLRTGQDVAGLGGFQEELRKEAGSIEAEELAAAEATAQEDSVEEAADAPAGPVEGAPEASAELQSAPEPGMMEEMD